MNQSKRTIYFLLLTLAICLFTSCGKKYTYTDEPIMVYEVNDTSTLKKDMDTVLSDGITFSFEKSIDKVERKRCIEKTSKILKKEALPDSLKICVFQTESYDGNYATDHTVYVNVQDWEGESYIATVLSAVYGEYCNYGLLWGYANYLANKNFKQELVTLPKDYSFDEEWEYYDLCYPAFLSGFSDEEDREIIIEMAGSFVSECISDKGVDGFREILVSSGNREDNSLFTDSLEEYYKTKGVDITISKLMFKSGGRTYEYVACNKYAQFFLSKGWEDMFAEDSDLFYDGFLFKYYKEMMKFFMVNTEQMAKYCELFEVSGKDVSIIFTNNQGGTWYNISKNTIYLRDLQSLMATYIISLINNEEALYKGWQVSGAASFFSYRYDYYGNVSGNEYYRSTSRYEAIEELKGKLNRELDCEKDYHEILAVMTYCESAFDPNESRMSGACFVGYLVQEYGEKNVIDMLFCTNDFEGLTGKSYQEVLDDWVDYLNLNYSEYTKE